MAMTTTRRAKRLGYVTTLTGAPSVALSGFQTTSWVPADVDNKDLSTDMVLIKRIEHTVIAEEAMFENIVGCIQFAYGIINRGASDVHTIASSPGHFSFSRISGGMAYKDSYTGIANGNAVGFGVTDVADCSSYPGAGVLLLGDLITLRDEWISSVLPFGSVATAIRTYWRIWWDWTKGTTEDAAQILDQRSWA